MKTNLKCTANFACGGLFDIELIETLPGFLSFRVIGKEASNLFSDEAGGHRIQQISPTDKNKRVHTSTITVAVLPEPTEFEVKINQNDLDIKTCRSSGSGGQHINKVESAVIITHIPTGISIRCENERSQYKNKMTAMAALRAKLQQQMNDKNSSQRSQDRKTQIGSAQRADKRRTIRFQDDTVTDHITGKTWRLKDYLRGDW